MNAATPAAGVFSAHRSYREANARQRVAALFDAASVQELLPPGERVVSPHLALFDTVGAFDDGVMIARARLGGQPVLLAAQEGGFMGGAVGEVHGAKLAGLLQRALHEPVAAVLLLLDSGGVRLHEANAGLLAVSEVMRALLQVRAHGVPVLVLIGGANGAFGGSGIVARCANSIIMSEEGRLAMSGPEVIESAHGVEEFDARDRALVWATTGGKHRYLLGDCQRLVPDDIDAFRQAALAEMQALQGQSAQQIGVNPDQLGREHAGLTRRLQQFGACHVPEQIWQKMGLADTASLPLLDAPQFVAQVAAKRLVLDDGDEDGAWPSGPLPQETTDTDAVQPGDWRALAQALFAGHFAITREGAVLHGSAQLDGRTLAVIGTCEHSPIGVEIALRQAQLVLDVLRQHPQRPILLLVDTSGQRLRHRDEMLGINSYMAHLGKC
ncbi:MAG: malonate decarboxylase beta subunit, partial [Pseudomonadota bacterium]